MCYFRFFFLCKFTTSLPTPTLIQVQGRPICLRLPALILQQGSCEARSVLWLQISDQGFCLISDHSLPLKWLLNLAVRKYPPPSSCLSVEVCIRARAMPFRTNVLLGNFGKVQSFYLFSARGHEPSSATQTSHPQNACKKTKQNNKNPAECVSTHTLSAREGELGR